MIAIRGILVALVLLFPGAVFAEEFNAGFVQGIWFGNEAVFADTPIRIYVALRNNTDHDLTGTVRFMDNEKRVGISYVSALPGRIVEAWTDWTPTYGEHTLIATLSNTQIHTLGESPEIIEVESAKSEIDIFVDYDTDKDGVGNSGDADDDGDDILDIDEVARGTDPLSFNQPSNVRDENDSQDESENSTGEDGGNNEDAKNVSDTPADSTPIRQGLEKYIENKAVSGALSRITDVVTESKSVLDRYRSDRNAERAAADTQEPVVTENMFAPASTSPSEIATITRTRIATGPGPIKTALGAAASLAGTLYAFMLWVLSEILSHPAFVQLVILLGILLILYRFARRFGKRPIDR